MPQPHDQPIREAVEPYLAGKIQAFACPPVANEFQCDGTLTDGGAFHVGVSRWEDGTLGVGTIVYDAQPPSQFFTDVRDYVKPNEPLQTVSCDLASRDPASFECHAGATTIQVGKVPDGSVRIYGIKIQHSYQRPPWAYPLVAGILLCGALAITIALVKILSLRRKLVVARLPLAAQQRVTFPAPGAYVLHAYGRRFSTQFAGLTYTLTDAAGTVVRSFPTILRAHTSGITHVQMALRRFFVESAGEHVLHIAGVRDDASEASLIFTEAWPLRGYLWIATAIAGGLTLMLGLFLLLAV